MNFRPIAACALLLLAFGSSQPAAGQPLPPSPSLPDFLTLPESPSVDPLPAAPPTSCGPAFCVPTVCQLYCCGFMPDPSCPYSLTCHYDTCTRQCTCG
jgi:hypothetical protein